MLHNLTGMTMGSATTIHAEAVATASAATGFPIQLIHGWASLVR